jgi:hypothetical protein
MNAKKWLKILILLSIIGIGAIGGINYLVDPLWNFSHKFSYNSVQSGFNERQQKTNYINFRNIDEYDGVLLGSSRARNINQTDFVNMNIFNYSSSSMHSYEYKGYIDFFKSKKKKKLKYIIIGADFYNTSKPIDVESKNPQFYIDKTKGLAYRYKVLFSIDGLKNSLINVRNFYTGKKGYGTYYDRNNINHPIRVSEKVRLKRYTKNLKSHTEAFMGPKYKYNTNLTPIYKSLKNDNPNTKIIIFTSPITADLLVSIIKNGDKLKRYKEWLKSIVNIFGEVHQFMDINSITTNLQNYPDADHYYDNIATLLANKIAGHNNKDIPNDFGIILNKSNVDAYFESFERKLEAYKSPLELFI